ncbi:DUF418 domain-containing protein [Marinitenerispora sediminis]|uniref:DUF418 domain-containing protein n=1 Tax=Marinitenerispora sediminis TaxID=1931232 RepID=A0A368SZQ7_9ACTN|nr:DUF418 domain-containing protein [Marinitenerispora sediminis]RCV48049.1 hypothetical protein DEF28_24590 [Marinitenerispora sediminis]RCV49138.1 hypothetical protein DEF23_24065 [Marinitenerispora sediminis]RCV51331.1 hypothetical protein DEF24_23300 [Marinitenerispora sediminis]
MSETVSQASGRAEPRSAPAPRAGEEARGRYLTPDLARGAMLLVIALVHAHMFLRGSIGVIRGYPTEQSVLDMVAAAGLTVFADGRGYPMFAALFGYGMAQILARQRARGQVWPATRRLLRRRGWFLLLFGFAHALLLFSGDILGTYGLIALLFVMTLRMPDRRLLAYAAGWYVVGAVIYAALWFSIAAGGSGSGAALVNSDAPLLDAVYRVSTWPVSSIQLVTASLCPFMIGVWAARRRLLEEPERHLRLLRRTAGLGIGLAVAGGLPLTLVTTQLWPDPPAGLALAFVTVHTLTGYAGGIGYAAAIALLAVRIGARRGPVVRAVAACGERSMTCYVWQSVVWMALFAPYTLDLGAHMGVAGSVAVGAATWLAGVAMADLMRRAGRRGPAEALLRRLTYGGRAAR